MGFDFDDMDGEDTLKVKNFNTQFIEALSKESAQAEISRLRETCTNRAQFERERAESLSSALEPIYAEHGVTLAWIENQNWVLKEEDEEVAEQFKSIEGLFGFGALGPLEAEKGDCVEASGLAAEPSTQTGVVLGFSEGDYALRFYPDNIMSVKAESLRKLSDGERLQHILGLFMAVLASPEARAELDGLRAACSKREHFDAAKPEKLSALLRPACAHFGVELEWVLERAEALSESSNEISKLQEQFQDATAFGSFGPLKLDRNDLVEFEGIDDAAQKHLNGQKGLVCAWYGEQYVYEVRVVGGEPAYVKAGSIRKLDDLERTRSVQKAIMDTLSGGPAQAALDDLRSRCVNVMQYAKKMPDILRQASASVYQMYGVEAEAHAAMVEANGKDRDLRSTSKRIETLTSFGKTGPWGLEKGAFYEAHSLLERGERELNGTPVLIRGWDDAKGCYDVSPVDSLGEVRSMKSENLKPIPDKAFASKDEAAAYQQALQEAYAASAAQEALSHLKATKPDIREYQTALRTTLLQLQAPVLEKFGFRPDFVGQNHVQRAMASYQTDPAFAQRDAELARVGLQELRFDGKVALVTGAGRGLGRAYAHLLAARGAKVVVNNRTRAKADEVVAEIVARGGTAVAEYSDVAVTTEEIVPAVLQHFGRIDIVVCNAGQLDDHRFEIMKTEYFTNLLQTHVYAHFKVLKDAWPHLAGQKYGRVVIVASETGLHGNWGQSNYGAAKMALMSMAQTLAMEGYHDGILCNAMCPVGLTRMTNDLRPPMFRAPEWELARTPQPSDKTVAYLCHETCRTTAGIFRAEEGHVQSLRWQADEAFVAFDPESPGALEAVAAQWTEFAKWEHVGYPGQELHLSFCGGKGQEPSETPFAGSRADKAKSADKLRYDGRVAVVTGGGRGLGRAYCLFLAARGAKVLVNNRTPEKADKVVAEIVAQGGAAVADYTDVAAAGEKVIAAAMEHFGQVDIVVCNAGIREDHPFAETSFEQFKANMETDLLGHVKVLQAAWPEMFMGRYGRIVMVTSDAGLHGHAGQLSWGAAKGAAIPMVETLGMEGHKYGIYVNVICTEGTTRMSSRLSDEQVNTARQSAAVPVAFLCHESCKASAGIFRVKAGKVQSFRWQSDEAFVDFDTEAGDAAVETVVAQWPDLARWEKVSYPGMAIHTSYRTGR